MRTPKTTVTVHLDYELYTAALKLASAANMSLSAFAALCVESGIGQ